MNLAVFDIDGTLVRSKAADGECYAEAWRIELGVEDVSPNTEDFRHSTDSGIAREIFLDRLGREGAEEETARLTHRFVELMRARARRSPAEFDEVPGAGAALARLLGDEGWAVAIATGCWRESALFKLSEAGFDLGDIPLATSDGLAEREAVVTLAVEKAKELHGRDGFGKVVYIGDGAWDCRAAASLGLPFVGVQDTRDAAPLREAGAATVIRDYTDLDVFLAALEEARVPAGA
jgi:phosphoglycolate phosphatase-like HAD superfamily hydrolase